MFSVPTQNLEETEKQIQEERAGLGRLETARHRDQLARTREDSRDKEEEEEQEEEEEEEDESDRKRLFEVQRDYRMSLILQEALCKCDGVLAVLTDRWGVVSR